MDDKQREAMEAANPGEKLGYRILWDKGSEWMHAHDAEKLALANWIRHNLESANCDLTVYEQRLLGMSQRIIAEAKEDTDGR